MALAELTKGSENCVLSMLSVIISFFSLEIRFWWFFRIFWQSWSYCLTRYWFFLNIRRYFWFLISFFWVFISFFWISFWLDFWYSSSRRLRSSWRTRFSRTCLLMRVFMTNWGALFSARFSSRSFFRFCQVSYFICYSILKLNGSATSEPLSFISSYSFVFLTKLYISGLFTSLRLIFFMFLRIKLKSWSIRFEFFYFLQINCF